MSGWQHEPQRGVHPLLYTTHHRALCTLKVHRADAPNDDVYGVFMTDLGWLPPLSPFGASASPAAVGAGLSLFFFFFVCHVTRNTPGIRTYMEMHGMHTSCSAAWFTLLMLTISHFSLCLSISSTSHPILSQSLSINKSFLAGCSRLNQPVCKHGY